MDLASPTNCLCFALRRATRSVTQAYDAALKPGGLTGAQFSLLAVLASLAPVSIAALAKALSMDRTTLTRNLGPLQRSRLVSVRIGDDRRARIIEITAKGRKRLAAAEPQWRAHQAKMVAAFGDHAARDLLAELSRVQAGPDRA